MKAVQISALAIVSVVLACGSSSDTADDTAVATSTGAGVQSATAPVSEMRRAAAGRIGGQMQEMKAMAAVGAFDGASGAPPIASNADAGAPPESPGVDPLQGIDVGSGAPAMVIRTGQAFIEVDKVDPAVLKIRQLAAQVGGYITNSSMSGGRDQIRQASLELKIPANKYDDAVGSLPSIGKVETVNSNAQDVGEEFVDVTARVTNSRRLEERLLSLLANRTGKLDEVLRVERELARVREEIERYEGRLRYLNARVAMSTLSITVHEPGPLLGNSPGENPIGAALRRAWKNFVSVIAGFIAALGLLIPLAVIAVAAWLVYRRWRKARAV